MGQFKIQVKIQYPKWPVLMRKPGREGEETEMRKLEIK